MFSPVWRFCLSFQPCRKIANHGQEAGRPPPHRDGRPTRESNCHVRNGDSWPNFLLPVESGYLRRTVSMSRAMLPESWCPLVRNVSISWGSFDQQRFGGMCRTDPFPH